MHKNGATRYHASKRGALILVTSLTRPIKTMGDKPLIKCRLKTAIGNLIVEHD